MALTPTEEAYIAGTVLVELQLEIKELRRQLEISRAHTPHFFHPSTTHIGNCSICGNNFGAPQHDVAKWKSRAMKAEQVLAIIRKALK